MGPCRYLLALSLSSCCWSFRCEAVWSFANGAQAFPSFDSAVRALIAVQYGNNRKVLVPQIRLCMKTQLLNSALASPGKAPKSSQREALLVALPPLSPTIPFNLLSLLFHRQPLCRSFTVNPHVDCDGPCTETDRLCRSRDCKHVLDSCPPGTAQVKTRGSSIFKNGHEP